MTITALNFVTAATEYGITLSEAKKHLRITHNYEDDYIQGLIASAHAWAQDYTRRVFLDSNVTVSFDRFPETNENVVWLGHRTFAYGRIMSSKRRDSCIFLAGGRVTKVNQITYFDELGVQQTITGPSATVPGTDYQEDLTDDELPMVFPAADTSWPAVQADTVNNVTVDYQVGWSSADELPEAIRQALRVKVAAMFIDRTSGESKAAESLLFPYVLQVV